DPQQAKFGAMPGAAIKAGVVDFVLPIAGVADELVRIARRPLASSVIDEEETVARGPDAADLRHVLALLRTAVGADFSEYKLSSVRRRIARRMAVLHVATLPEYVERLR